MIATISSITSSDRVAELTQGPLAQTTPTANIINLFTLINPLSSRRFHDGVSSFS
jgi:hypothetical protein